MNLLTRKILAALISLIVCTGFLTSNSVFPNSDDYVLAADITFTGTIALPTGETAASDISVQITALPALLSIAPRSVTVVIASGQSSVNYSIVSIGNPGESLQYRITGNNPGYVSSGFIYPKPGNAALQNLGATTLERGTELSGRILLPAGTFAGSGGMKIVIEANYITAFMKIPEGASYGNYKLVVPKGLTYKIYYSILSGLTSIMASEWVYSTGTIGQSVTDVTASGSYMTLSDQTIPSGKKLSGVISLPNNQSAKNALTVSLSPKLILPAPGIALYETPEEALFSGLSSSFIIPAGQKTCNFTLSLPQGEYALEYRIIKGLTDEDISPKGTILTGNSRRTFLAGNTPVTGLAISLNQVTKLYSISGNIVLPAGKTAKAGGLRVNIDVVNFPSSINFATHYTVTIPAGQSSSAFSFTNIQQGQYSVNYNIVEQAADYPDIDYNASFQTITLNQNLSGISFYLTANIPPVTPSNPVPNTSKLFSDLDPAFVPANPIPAQIPVGGRITYYISSEGNDNNNGTSISTPFRTLAKISTKTFYAGDKILFRASDRWTGTLVLRGSGNSTKYIQVSSYGSGDKPVIEGADPAQSVLLQLQNGSYWSIDGLKFENAKLGVFVQYNNTANNSNVSVRNCDFNNFTDGPTVTMSETTQKITDTSNQYGFASAIFLGGILTDTLWDSTIFTGLEVKDCSFNYCDGAVSSNWYMKEFYKDRIKSVHIENISITDSTICSIALNQVNGARLTNIAIENSDDSVFTEFGITNIFLHGCSNMIIDGYTAKELNRGYSGDGSVIDFEYCKNITLQNSDFSNIDGMGLELLDTTPYIHNMAYLPDQWLFGYNRNILIKDTVIFNSSRRPHTLPDGEDLFFDVYNRNPRTEVRFENVIFYESRGSHGTFSIKKSNFSYSGYVRVDLDIALEQTIKTADFAILSLPDKITSSTLFVNDQSGLLSSINLGTSVQILLNQINERLDILMFSGNTLISDGLLTVGTGMKAAIYNGNYKVREYTTVVTGDVTGSGKISISGLLSIKKHLLGVNYLDGVFEIAGDTDSDSFITLTDLVNIRKHLLQQQTIQPIGY